MSVVEWNFLQGRGSYSFNSEDTKTSLYSFGAASCREYQHHCLNRHFTAWIDRVGIAHHVKATRPQNRTETFTSLNCKIYIIPPNTLGTQVLVTIKYVTPGYTNAGRYKGALPYITRTSLLFSNKKWATTAWPWCPTVHKGTQWNIIIGDALQCMTSVKVQHLNCRCVNTETCGCGLIYTCTNDPMVMVLSKNATDNCNENSNWGC